MFRKPTFNSLYDPFGSPYRGQKPSLPLKKEFFLPLRLSCKESSTFSPSPSSSGSGDVTALRCSEPLRYKVGGPSKVSPYCAGWDHLIAKLSIHNLKTYLLESAKRKDLLYIIVSSSLTLMLIQRTFNAFSICSFILIEAKLSILGELSIISCSIRSRKEVDSRDVKVLL